HEHRDDGQLVQLRAADRGLGNSRNLTQFAFQLLRHMRNHSLISTLLTILMLLPATAQRPAVQTPVKPPAPGTPTFHANSNLVIVDVSAKDKCGLTVEGLKAEDFT